MNVRLAPPAGPQSARASGDSALARLLLRTSLKLLLLLALSSSTPACVLPISPEFQDPPGAPNAAPEITGSNFFPGAQVVATTMQTFSFTISDPNGSATLYVRWVADVDPFSANARIIERNIPFPPNADGSPQVSPVQETIFCNNLASGPTHQIVAAVADHPFRDDINNDYLAVSDTGKKSIIPWTLTLTSCQLPQSP
jgi:hypothetical protein